MCVPTLQSSGIAIDSTYRARSAHAHSKSFCASPRARNKLKCQAKSVWHREVSTRVVCIDWLYSRFRLRLNVRVSVSALRTVVWGSWPLTLVSKFIYSSKWTSRRHFRELGGLPHAPTHWRTHSRTFKRSRNRLYFVFVGSWNVVRIIYNIIIV